MEIKAEYPTVLVVWEDITQSDSGWKSIDEALQWADSEKTLVHQTGFKIDQTEEHILIVDQIFAGTDLIGSMTKIPMNAVKDIITLKGVK